MKENIFGGDLVAKPGVVYEYEKITGYLDASGADTKTDFPRLQTVGGCLDARGEYSHVKQNDSSVLSISIGIKEKCRIALLASFAAEGLSFADGVLARIVSKRGPVTKVIVCGKTEISFVVTDGENNSHGKTIQEARDGLIYKITNRDTTEFKGWTLEKSVSKRDAIRAYRCITGACEAGVRGWMERHKDVPDTITVQEIVDITVGAYGHDTFKKFFTN